MAADAARADTATAAASAAAAVSSATAVKASSDSNATLAVASVCPAGTAVVSRLLIKPAEQEGGGSGLGSGSSPERRGVPAPGEAPVTGLPEMAVAATQQKRSRVERPRGTAQRRVWCGLTKRHRESTLPCEKGSFFCCVSHGSPFALSLSCLYTEAVLLFPASKDTPAPSSRAHPRGTVVPHRACPQGRAKRHACSSPPCAPVWRRLPALCIPRRAAALACACRRAPPRQPARQAPPPPVMRKRWRPLSRMARPRPSMHSAAATVASTLAAGWPRPPLAPKK